MTLLSDDIEYACMKERRGERERVFLFDNTNKTND